MDTKYERDLIQKLKIRMQTTRNNKNTINQDSADTVHPTVHDKPILQDPRTPVRVPNRYQVVPKKKIFQKIKNYLCVLKYELFARIVISTITIIVFTLVTIIWTALHSGISYETLTEKGMPLSCIVKTLIASLALIWILKDSDEHADYDKKRSSAKPEKHTHGAPTKIQEVPRSDTNDPIVKEKPKEPI